MRARPIATLTGLLLAATSLVTPTPALATGIDLGLAGFKDIVVDEAHGKVFLSQGNAGDIVVTDAVGVKIGSITGTSGTFGMALSPDSSTVWAARSAANEIVGVDTQSLATTAFATPDTPCPENLAVTAGLVWFGHFCDYYDGGIGALDPSDGTVTAVLPGGRPRVFATPALPDTLISFSANVTPATLRRFTASAGTPPALAQQAQHYDFAGGSIDAAFTPDGSQIVVTSSQELNHYQQLINVSDLSVATWYGTGTSTWPAAVAISSDGVVAGGYDWDPDVLLFLPGRTAPVVSYDLATNLNGVLIRGLAFGNGHLYAMTHGLELHVLDFGSVQASTDAATYDYGSTATVVGTLLVGSSNPQLQISSQEYGGADQPIALGDVVGGQLSTTTTVRRTTTFTVSWDGDGDHGSGSATRTVKVRAAVTAQLLGASGHQGRYATYPAKGSATVSGVVKPNHSGDCVRFRVEAHLSGRWKPQSTSACVTLNAQSKATAKIKATAALRGKDLRVRTLWGGDAENLAAKSAYRYFRFKK